MDDEFTTDDTGQERRVEDVTLLESASLQRIIAPAHWGRATLLGTAERGALLLYHFGEVPHFLCWRLPDDQDVIVEVLPDTDPDARDTLAALEQDEAEMAVNAWILPDDIDQERLHYPSAWGRPSAVIDAWLDGGPLVLTFEDEAHVVRWELGEDTLLALVANGGGSQRHA